MQNPLGGQGVFVVLGYGPVLAMGMTGGGFSGEAAN
jgi:hypothetical protein